MMSEAIISYRQAFAQRVILETFIMQKYYRKRFELLEMMNHPLDLVFAEDLYYHTGDIYSIIIGYDNIELKYNFMSLKVKFSKLLYLDYKDNQDFYLLPTAERRIYPVLLNHKMARVSIFNGITSPNPITENDLKRVFNIYYNDKAIIM